MFCDELVCVEGVDVSFGPTSVLCDVSLHVAAGEVVGLVGPNGSGKSTTLRVVTGELVPRRGTVRVAGTPAGSLLARAATGVVPDEPIDLDLTTVNEYLGLVGALWDAPDSYAVRVDAALGLFGLTDRRNARIESLSNGMRRILTMVALAGLDPAVAVIDEASATLDPEAVLVLRELLRHLARTGSAVLCATQDLGFAQRCCDRVILLAQGAVVVQGTPDALMARYEVTDLEGVFLAATAGANRAEEVRRVLGDL